MAHENPTDVLPILGSDEQRGFDPAMRGYDRAQVDDGMRDWSPPADLVARVDRARAALRQRAES